MTTREIGHPGLHRSFGHACQRGRSSRMQCNDDEGEYEPHQRAKPGYRGEEYDREDEQGDRPIG